MQAFVTLLLTAAMLLHATFGCCMHHVHACAAECYGYAAAGEEECPCGDHHEATSKELASREEHDECGEEHSHHGPHACEGEQCSFTRTENKSDASLKDGHVPCFLVAMENGSLPAAKLRHRFASFRPAGDCFTLRRHLALSVLLI